MKIISPLKLLLILLFISNLGFSQANISITKSAQTSFCNQDYEINYTIIITNTGTDTLTNIQITDDNADNITPNVISSLPLGQSVYVIATHFITFIDRLNGVIENSATVTALDSNGQTISDLSDDPNNSTDVDVNGNGNPDDITVVEQDTDCDGNIDTEDIDDDNDGIIDIVENDGIDPNQDEDGDNIPQFIDDNDNDATIGNEDGLPQNDTDGDNIPNHLDIDSDNDGIPDNIEAQSTNSYISPTGLDSDGDGLDEAYDNNNSGLENSLGLELENTDQDGNPDYLDLDSDNDGVPDNIEGNDQNHDGIADDALLGTDEDHDGLDDGFEGSNTDDAGDVNDEIDLPIIDLPDNDSDALEDGNVDYRDLDDDNDGLSTINEDTNNDGNYSNDDDNTNGIPDYLDENTTISINDFLILNFDFSPNPVKDILTIKLPVLQTNINFVIYSIQGNEIIKRKTIQNLKTAVNISRLSSGVYFIKLENENQNVIRKFVKE